MAADDGAVFGDNFTFRLIQRNSTLARVGLNELNVVAGWNEAEFHAFRLFGDGKIYAASKFANFFFC